MSVLSSTRSPLFRLLALGAAGTIAACGGGTSPMSPAEADDPVATTPMPEPAAVADLAVTATTAPRIAFASYRNSNMDIFSMDPQGYNVKRLTTVSGYEIAPAWSWDNKRIALMRPRKDAANVIHNDIYIINADGTNGHWALPTPSPYTLMYPSWAPDGSHVLVTVARDGGWYIGWVNLTYGVLGNFAIGGQAVPGKQPSYDATGQRIVYVGTGSSKYTLDVVNANGTGHATLLTAAGPTIDRPAFSPDGSRIAFVNTAGNGDYEIFLRKADGSIKRLTYSAGDDGWPSWSPDGTKIVFESRRNGQRQIWSMSATGGSATRLSHNSYQEQTAAFSH